MPKPPDAIILCGGAGVRLREIAGDRPKAMVRIVERPFLELLFKQLRRNGFERAILAVGYQQNMIRAHFGEQACGLQLVYSPESSPLGTGGALRNATDRVESDVALVMNGDSYTDADLTAFVAYHRESQADVSLVVAPARGRDDCGNVHVMPDGSVTRFEEKQGSFAARYLNAGIYVLSPRMLYDIPPAVKVSLEEELFCRWLAEGRSVKAYLYSGICFDIGTPERYRNAQERLAKAEGETTLQKSPL